MKLNSQLNRSILLLLGLQCVFGPLRSQETITVKPAEIDEVLTNPGMGFMTFQRFNGDELNEGIGWTEGFPIEYQNFDGNLEPEQGIYQWEHIDKALATARKRGQQLLIRVAPYGNNF